MKLCRGCGVEKRIEDFYRAGEKICTPCKQCRSDKAKARHEANPELKQKARERAKAWAAANPELHRARALEWNRANKEKRRISCQKWEKANPWSKKARRSTISSRFRNGRSRARARGIQFDITLEEYIAAFSGAICVYCQGKLPETGSGMDRVDNSLGYAIGNIVPCCAVCNIVKADNFSYSEMLRLGELIRVIMAERQVSSSSPVSDQPSVQAPGPLQ